MLLLIKEDGSGKPDANSYADIADGNTYYDGHLYAVAWTNAPDDRKNKALVMATRLIDAEYEFFGRKVIASQSLQWPRSGCPDPDAPEGVIWLPANKVPKAVIDATCEMAHEVLTIDRTAAPPGEGISSVTNSDLSRTVYSKKDTRPIISRLTQAMLAKYGNLIPATTGTARLFRV